MICRNTSRASMPAVHRPKTQAATTTRRRSVGRQLKGCSATVLPLLPLAGRHDRLGWWRRRRHAFQDDGFFGGGRNHAQPLDGQLLYALGGAQSFDLELEMTVDLGLGGAFAL